MFKWLEGFFLDDKGAKSMSRLGHFAGIIILSLLALVLGFAFLFSAKVAAMLALIVKCLTGGGAGGYLGGKVGDAFGSESSAPDVEEDAT